VKSQLTIRTHQNTNGNTIKSILQNSSTDKNTKYLFDSKGNKIRSWEYKLIPNIYNQQNHCLVQRKSSRINHQNNNYAARATRTL